ncbi:MAG: hypothetical protein DCC49_00095 [Acidobacteria bacterium]|nr:MAG: hypothetical protein DCC49_00095 [Acidobacteriota bacterium]
MSTWIQDEGLLATFKTEVGERLSSLQSGLLQLESQPDNIDVMNAIFRDAHTIKGSAKMMGFGAVKEVAHRMEDVLGDVKEGQLPLTGDLADLLLESSDAILGLLDDGEDPSTLPPAAEALLGRLEAARPGAGFQPPPTTAPKPAPPSTTKEKSPPREIPTSPGRLMRKQSSSSEESATTPASGDISDAKGGGGEQGASLLGAARISGERRAVSHDDDVVSPSDSAEIEVPADSAIEVLAAEAEEAPAGPAGARNEGFVNPIGQSIRIEAGKLYELIDQVGEVVIGEVRLEEVSKGLTETMRSLEGRLRRMRHKEGDPELVGILDELRERVGVLSAQLAETLRGQSRGLDRLQEQSMRLAMLPTASIFAPFPRLIRNLCRELGKEVDLQLDGGGTELDKQVLEQIVDPIRHLLINAVDHGIEPPEEREASGKPRRGSLTVTARQQGRQVVIEVRDDGRGISPEAVKASAVRKGLIDEGDELSNQEALALLFKAGFSTAGIVTDTSGRGVGLDVVKEAVDRLKGTVDIDSVPGDGTVFSITLPITLAIIEAILVNIGGQEFAIPVSAVEEVVGVPEHDVQNVGGREAVVLRDQTTSLVPLHKVLSLPEDEIPDGPVVVIATATRRVAFRVGELIGQQEVVIKGLGSFLPRMRHVAGASILGDGRVILVLDPYELIDTARRPLGSSAAPVQRRTGLSAAGARPARILVVDDSLAIREMLRSIFEAAGYSVEVAVDGADGLTKVRQQKFDGVITDVEMPRLDGFGLVEGIRSRSENENLPVIMVTSLAKEEHRRRGLEVGANAYIVKSSFDQSTLLETLRSLVGR